MKKPDIFDMLADIPQKIVDESAFSMAELCEKSGQPPTNMVRIIADNLKSGKWERVYKRGKRQLVYAYRIKASRRSVK